jgi:hypothetical protein
VFLICRAAEWLLYPEGAASVVLRCTGTLALAWWAVSEVLRGVNPFRRMLGAAVLVAVLIGTIGDVAVTAALRVWAPLARPLKFLQNRLGRAGEPETERGGGGKSG